MSKRIPILHLAVVALVALAAACGSPDAPGVNLSYASADPNPADGAVGDATDEAGADATAAEDAAAQDAAAPDASLVDAAAADASQADVAPADVAPVDVAPVDVAPVDVAAGDVALVDVPAAVCQNCDDQDPCTDDVCVAATGNCKHAAKPGCAKPTGPCASACATGVCDPQSHACVECVGAAGCDPSQFCQLNHCTAAAACKSSAECKATQQVCDASVGHCVDCAAASDCASGQACVEHACVAAPACKSDKECTDVCDKAKGVCVACVASNDCLPGAWCTPWQKCAPDVCTGNACAAAAVFLCKADGSGYDLGLACSDGNVCTSDGCDPVKGCVFTAATGACNDGNLCTTGDACQGGKCAGAVDANQCKDNNPCTVDGCGASGCTFSAAFDGTACDDGNANTTSDACSGGICKGKTMATAGCTSASDKTYIQKLASSSDAQEKLQDVLYNCILGGAGSGGCFGQLPGSQRATCVASCAISKGIPISSTCSLCWGWYGDCVSTHCLSACVGGAGSSGCQSCQNAKCGAAKDACIAGK